MARCLLRGRVRMHASSSSQPKNASEGLLSASRIPSPALPGVPLLSISLALAAGPTLLHAQAPSNAQVVTRQLEETKALEQFRTTRTLSTRSADQTVPETYPGESADLGQQKLLTEKPRIRYFEANADTQFAYTSNANLERRNPKDTGIWASTFFVAFNPPAWEAGPGSLSLSTGYRHMFWVYDVKRQNDSNFLNDGNFELSSLFATLRYAFRENWRATLGVDYNRVLTGKSRYDASRGYSAPSWRMGRLFEWGNWQEVYTEYNPNWSLERNFPISKKTFASLSYNGGYHFTETDPNPTRRVNDRLDSALMGSVVYMPTAAWMFQPFARVAHNLYTRSGAVDPDAGKMDHRRDLTRILGMNVIWSVSPRLTVRTSVSGEFRNSNDPLVADYGRFEAATGVNFSYKF
ncbi:MAG: hypothetical protein RLZZ142_562 [Verrucomicrobiota bacterium]